MNRIRLLSIGMMMFALTMVAQAAMQSDRPTKDEHSQGGAHGGGTPTVETNLKVLTAKLGPHRRSAGQDQTDPAGVA